MIQSYQRATLIMALGALIVLPGSYLTYQWQQVSPTECIPTTILFDLDNVLFTINRPHALSSLGLFTLLGYIFAGGKGNKLEDKLFSLLDMLSINNPLWLPKDNQLYIPMHNQKPLPAVMRHWMSGSIAGPQALELTHQAIEEQYQKGFFISNQERTLVSRAATLLFDPTKRCKLYKPIKKGIALLKECKKLGHKVYLVSNMDTELIDLLKKEYPDIFSLFDGLIISAALGTMKPYPSIYEYTLSTYAINPATCYLIDDRYENIVGAESVGIQGIHCNFKTYKDVYRTLRSHGILPNKRKVASIKDSATNIKKNITC